MIDFHDAMKYEWNDHIYIHYHSYNWYDFEWESTSVGIVIPKTLEYSFHQSHTMVLVLVIYLEKIWNMKYKIITENIILIIINY